MNKRINVMLSEETLELMDSVAKKGERSKLVEKAVRFYVVQKAQDNLREQMKQEALAYADISKEMAEEWFSLDDDMEIK